MTHQPTYFIQNPSVNTRLFLQLPTSPSDYLPISPSRLLGLSKIKTDRIGLTLIEVLLALSLTVLVTGLIGGLIQIYQGHLEIAKDNVRQARIARAILTMIADDIRGVLRSQSNDDATTLEKFLTASAASNATNGVAGQIASALGGGQSGGSQTSSGQTSSGQSSGGQSSGGQSGGTQSGAGKSSGSGGASGTSSSTSSSTASSSTNSTSSNSTSSDATTTPAPPPGIYGTENAIEIDVSRPPRPDEYIAEAKNRLESKMTDIPSDTKKVSYYVQASQLNGIQDPLNNAAGAGIMANGGLVRRSLDRAITRWTQEQGHLDQITNTGQLLAPEIIALSFSYFDGVEWTTTWDSSAQGLPWAIQITIAMQHAKQARNMPLPPGMSLQNILSMTKSESGIETYSILAMVPGAQLLKTPADQATTGNSTSSTSSLGF